MQKLEKMTNCALRALPKLRRTIGITLIYCMVRQRIRRLIEFTVDVPNIPRDAKMGQGIANKYTLSMERDEVFQTGMPKVVDERAA